MGVLRKLVKLFLFERMASKEENIHKLNALFRSMGERGKEGEIWKEHTEHSFVYVFKVLSKFLSRNGDNSMMFQAYGSAVEDLKSMAPTDAGDLDIVISPSSDALMIQDEMIEYSESPMHVRIKAVGHKNLRSCLVEDTQYLATSALKNFHPAIYGRQAPHLIKTIVQALEVMSIAWNKVAFEWRNKDASPALQIDYRQTFGPISGEIERLNNPDGLVNLDVSEWEWLVHTICSSRGIEYSKEHAAVIKEYIDFGKEVQMSFHEKGLLAKPETFPLLLQEFTISDRARDFQQRFREIGSRMENERRRKEDNFGSSRETQQNDSQVTEKCDENRSGSGNEGRSVTTPFLEYKGEKSECPSLQAAIDSTFEEPSGCSENGMTKQPAEVTKGEKHEISKNKREDEGLVNREIQIIKRNEEQQNPGSTTPGDAFIEDDPQKGEKDLKTLLSETDHFLQHFFFGSKAAATNTEQDPKEQQTPNDTPVAPIVGGFDLVPALKCSGWPKVAMEWITRERNWPSPDVVAKVVHEGFHLVAKPSKKAITPECDFRISFSHAEYLLSREMNDTQRECYRCLKTFHRGYLKKEAETSTSLEETKSLKTTETSKGLVTFHLKNIFLKTIETTDAEMWSDGNRVECMRMLFGNLLEALRDRDLRHYFVDSYNLFSEDYIDDPEILDYFAKKVEKIIDDPEGVAKRIEEKQKKLQKGDNEGQGSGDGQSSFTSPVNSGQGKSHSWSNSTGMAADVQGKRGYRFHDLKEIYLAIGQELIGMAFSEDPLLDVSDTERRLVEDLRELIIKHKMTAEDFSKIFKCFWSSAYYKVSNDLSFMV